MAWTLWKLLYNVAAIILAMILFRRISIRYLWIYIVAEVLLSFPVSKALQNMSYRRLIEKTKK